MALSASWLSGLLFLNARIPLRFVHIHIGIAALPSLVSLLALVNNNGDRVVVASRYFSLVNGFLCSYNWFNHSAFLCTLFNGRSLISKILCTFTFTTGVSSVAWLSDDLRLMLICWGATLIGLVLLIGLNKGWKVVSEATKISGYLFTISWIALLSAIIWLFK